MYDKKSVIKRHIKGGFLILKAQILASVTCLIIYLLAFFFLKRNTFGFTVYSIFSMITTFLFIYADTYKIAENDLKTYHNFEHYSYKGIILAIVPLLLTTILITCWQFVYLSSLHSLLVIIQFIFVGFTFPYQAFMQLDENHITILSYFIIYLFPLLSAGLGYYAGTKNFSLYNKLIYPIIYKKKK